MHILCMILLPEIVFNHQPVYVVHVELRECAQPQPQPQPRKRRAPVWLCRRRLCLDAMQPEFK